MRLFPVEHERPQGKSAVSLRYIIGTSNAWFILLQPSYGLDPETMSDPSSIPPTVAPVIEAYAKAIRPAFGFILISSIFGAMLVPLLIILLASSTPHSRRQPIFILNVLSLSLGITVSGLSTHLSIHTVLYPLQPIFATEDLVQVVLYTWMPWISGAILILRVVIIFAPQYTSRWHLLPLFIFPFIVKIARAVLIIIFIVQWKRRSVQNQFQATAQLDTWIVKSSWILEMADNGYISLLFLWRLSARAHIFDRSKTGAVKERGVSISGRLQSLFWITSTNFIFPLIFNLCQVIVIFVSNDVLLAASIENVNIYVSIICCVFASIWASTSSFNASSFTAQDDAVPRPSKPSHTASVLYFRAPQHNDLEESRPGHHIPLNSLGQTSATLTTRSIEGNVS